MPVQYNIDDAKKLFNDRAGTRGVSSNVTPDKFNRFWQSAELKFFNTRYDEYYRKQTISDSISKWMSDPLWLQVDATGKLPFFTDMNLLHVDSLSSYLPQPDTGVIGTITIVPGSGYTDGTYTDVELDGGTGTGAVANVIVADGAVTTVIFTKLGTGYAITDALQATLGLTGTGWGLVVNTLNSTTDKAIERVEKNKIAKHLSSEFEPPTQEFAIYTQYADYFGFYPINVGVVKMVYLQQPVWSFWGYTLNGYIATLTGLVGGSLYTNGTYTNVPLTGGAGNGALATIVVSGNAVTSVTLTNPGKIYKNGDTLSASNGNIGGTGSGFSITVSSLVPGSIRPIYDPNTSVQPKWNNDDISTIIDIALADAAISARDKELTSFAEKSAQTQQ